MTIIKPRCPVCGCQASVQHDRFQGMDFGYSVGCVSCCNDDGIHGITVDTPMRDRFNSHCFSTKEGAIKWWHKRVERYRNEVTS